MKEWVKMPSDWLKDENSSPLSGMKWSGPTKADQIAGLMIYIVLLHHANDLETIGRGEIGLCSLTYTMLEDITGLSRSKISGGLKVLQKIGIVTQVGVGRNNIYKIEKYGTHSGWAKLPARGLYAKNSSKITAFHNFKLRSKNELNALKIYLLIAAFRDTSTNYAKIGYERISEYTGIHKNNIKSALSLLINHSLLQVDSGNSDANQYATYNMYRLCHLEPHRHRGTTTRDAV